MLIRTIFSGICTGLAILVALAGFICVANSHHAVFYLMDIFTLPILSGAVVLTALFLLLRQGRAAILSTLGVALLVLAMVPQVFPHQGPAARGAKPVKLVFANMFVRNTKPQKILPWIAEKDPDIIALVEVNGRERDDLVEKLKVNYPNIVLRYDMVIASRFPLIDTGSPGAGFALKTVMVKTPQGVIYLAVTHLTRPWPFKRPEDQPRQFDRLAAALQPLPPARMVLVGDFNTTPSAAQLHDFAESLDLHTAPALVGTWEGQLPPLLRVPIDNVLASADLNLSHREVGPDDGSDHRPVFVEIRPAKGD